ncbi:Blp family class II bacteriocin [Bacillus subtilis]
MSAMKDLNTNFIALHEKELMNIDGGKYSAKGYAKTLLTGTAFSAGSGAVIAGPAGAFVGAHFGAIGSSVKYLITGD